MVLFIEQKAFSLVHKYHIYNRSGELCFYGEGKKRSGIQLYDRKGKEIFYIKRRRRSFFECYEFYRYNRLYALSVKKPSFSNSKIRFKIFSVFGSFEIESDLFGVNFAISTEDEMICAVKNHLQQFEDIYEIYMEKNRYVNFYIALVISFDLYLKNKGIARP